mgnify:CR=1 FL=1
MIVLCLSLTSAQYVLDPTCPTTKHIKNITIDGEHYKDKETYLTETFRFVIS